LGPSLLFVDGEGNSPDGVSGGGSDGKEDEALLSEDEDGEMAGDWGAVGEGNDYDAFNAPPFAESWEAWKEEETMNEQREAGGGTAYFEDNESFDPGEPPSESLHPWEIGQPILQVGNFTSALTRMEGESGGHVESMEETCMEKLVTTAVWRLC
jgi:hypothetical protein